MPCRTTSRAIDPGSGGAQGELHAGLRVAGCAVGVAQGASAVCQHLAAHGLLAASGTSAVHLPSTSAACPPPLGPGHIHSPQHAIPLTRQARAHDIGASPCVLLPTTYTVMTGLLPIPTPQRLQVLFVFIRALTAPLPRPRPFPNRSERFPTAKPSSPPHATAAAAPTQSSSCAGATPRPNPRPSPPPALSPPPPASPRARQPTQRPLIPAGPRPPRPPTRGTLLFLLPPPAGQ